VILRGVSGSLRIDFEYAGQLGMRGLMNDSNVILAERSGSNDSDARLGHCSSLERKRSLLIQQ